MSDDLLGDLLGMLDEDGEKGDIIVKQPLFNYAGSKFRSVKEIIPMLPVREGYIEPFGGTGSILLNRKRSKLEVLNDRNGGIADFYRCVQDPDLLAQLIDKIELSIHSKELFVLAKKNWQQAASPLERGYLWYYCTMTSFSAQARNWARSTTPNSATCSRKMFDRLPKFKGIHYRLRGVQVENSDFRRIMGDYNHRDSVLYLDPPYPSTATCMYNDKMNKFDYKAMFELIEAWKGFVAISGYKQEADFLEQVEWDDNKEWEVQTSVQSAAGNERNNKKDIEKRGTNIEVLYWKDNR